MYRFRFLLLFYLASPTLGCGQVINSDLNKITLLAEENLNTVFKGEDYKFVKLVPMDTITIGHTLDFYMYQNDLIIRQQIARVERIKSSTIDENDANMVEAKERLANLRSKTDSLKLLKNQIKPVGKMIHAILFKVEFSHSESTSRNQIESYYMQIDTTLSVTHFGRTLGDLDYYPELSVIRKAVE